MGLEEENIVREKAGELGKRGRGESWLSKWNRWGKRVVVGQKVES